MQVVQLEATAVVASLLPGLLTYYPVDQFAVAPPLPGTPPGAGLVVEAWASNKLRPGSPPFAAPRWHLPSEAEVRARTMCARGRVGLAATRSRVYTLHLMSSKRSCSAAVEWRGRGCAAGFHIPWLHARSWTGTVNPRILFSC